MEVVQEWKDGVIVRLDCERHIGHISVCEARVQIRTTLNQNATMNKCIRYTVELPITDPPRSGHNGQYLWHRSNLA